MARDAYDYLERRVQRRIGVGGAADALVARCRERSVTAGVAGSCTCAELMEELGVSEEEASTLRLDDAGWAGSIWPLFGRMAEAGLHPQVIREARAAMAALPTTLAQLRGCSPRALADARVPLAVRVWLRARGAAPPAEDPPAAAAAAPDPPDWHAGDSDSDVATGSSHAAPCSAGSGWHGGGTGPAGPALAVAIGMRPATRLPLAPGPGSWPSSALRPGPAAAPPR